MDFLNYVRLNISGKSGFENYFKRKIVKHSKFEVSFKQKMQYPIKSPIMHLFMLDKRTFTQIPRQHPRNIIININLRPYNRNQAILRQLTLRK